MDGARRLGHKCAAVTKRSTGKRKARDFDDDEEEAKSDSGSVSDLSLEAGEILTKIHC